MTKISEFSTDSSISGTEKLVSLDGTTNGVILVSAISTYVITDLLDSTQQTSITTSDEFIIERGDAAIKVDEQYVTSRVLDSAFDSADGTAAASGDLVLVERSGTRYTLDVDDISTYVQPTLSTFLDISSLGDASLSSGVYLAIGEGSTPTKVTLANLETQLWDDFDTYVTGLGAVATLAGGDAFYVLDGGTPQKILASTIGTYVVTNNSTAIIASAYDVDPIASLASGDEFICETSNTPKTATIDQISTYVTADMWDPGSSVLSLALTDDFLVERGGSYYLCQPGTITSHVITTAWDNTTDVAVVTSLVAADKLLLGRSGAAKQMTWENFAAGIQSTILTHSGLSACSDPQSTDTFIIGDAGTPKKITLSTLETTLWTDWNTYFTGLSAVGTVQATDKIPLNQGGTAYHVTPLLLATYLEGAIGTSIVADVFDGADIVSLTSGDLVAIESGGVLKSADVDYFTTFIFSKIVAAGAATPTVQAGDDFVFSRGGTKYIADIDEMAGYFTKAIGAQATSGSVQAGDSIVVCRAGTTYYDDIDDLGTYLLTGYEATAIDISGMSAAASLTSDTFVLDESGTTKTVTYSALQTQIFTGFYNNLNATLTQATLADGNKFYVDSDGAKYTTASDIYDYIETEMWNPSGSLLALDDTDKFVVQYNVTGELRNLYPPVLKNYIVSEGQDDILNISGLNSATLSSADYFLVHESGEAKQSTGAEVVAYILGELDTYINAIGTSVATVADSDIFYCIQGGTEKKVTPVELATYFYTEVVEDLVAESAKASPISADSLLVKDSENGDALKWSTINDIAETINSSASGGWTVISTDYYTATPASTSTITMSDTSDMAVGYPVKYAYGGTTYYGMVTAVTTDTSITITGATLNTGSDLTSLHVGSPSMIKQVEFFIEWPYGDAVQDCLTTVAEQNYKWQYADAYLVSFSAAHHYADTGATEPKINIKIGTGLVSTNDSNNGIQMSASADTWVDNSAVAINTTNYLIERGDAVEIRCTAVGTNGDAECLSVSCIFVLE